MQKSILEENSAPEKRFTAPTEGRFWSCKSGVRQCSLDGADTGGLFCFFSCWSWAAVIATAADITSSPSMVLDTAPEHSHYWQKKRACSHTSSHIWTHTILTHSYRTCLELAGYGKHNTWHKKKQNTLLHGHTSMLKANIIR